MITTPYPMFSVLPSSEIDYGIVRTGFGANPVHTGPKPSRETAPLAATANPRVMHPKLNTTGWNRSYAQARSEPRTARPVGRYKGFKRTVQTRKQQARKQKRAGGS